MLDFYISFEVFYSLELVLIIFFDLKSFELMVGMIKYVFGKEIIVSFLGMFGK